MKKLLLVLVLFLGLCGCSGSDDKDKADEKPKEEEKGPEGEVRLFDDEVDGEKIVALSLEYKGKTRSGVFSVQEIMNDYGFTYFGGVEGNEMVKPNMSDGGGFNVYLDEATSTLLNAWNTSDEEKPLSECLVTRFDVAMKGFSVNDITIGEDTYDTVIEKYGRQDEFRGNSIEEEKNQNGYVQDVSYYGDFEFDSNAGGYPMIGNRQLKSIQMIVSFDSEGVVNDINITVQHDSI